jgi:site-specific recombinase XerD
VTRGPATVVRGRAGRIWSHAGADKALRVLGLELEAQRQGIAGLRWHVTRHTYAARVLQAGGSIYVLRDLLGHASVATTERYYAHLVPDQLADAVRSVGRAEGGEG